MACPTHELLVSFVARDLPAADRTLVETHLGGGCADCLKLAEEIEMLQHLASSEALVDPPPWVFERALETRRASNATSAVGLFGSVASLVYDSLRQALPSGARSSNQQSRQMLYRALEYDIDIRISPLPGGLVRISGQVLPGSNRPIEDVQRLEVALSRLEIGDRVEFTNDLGEFAFDALSHGPFTLAIEAPEERLLIRDLYLLDV